MVTQESLQKRYSECSNVELLEIVSNQEGYSELAISVATKEIAKRKLPAEVLKNYKSIHSLVFDVDVENWLVDLHIWQKMLLYLIWFPRWRSYITGNFYTKEYYLKVRQSNYYLVGGVSFAILGAILYGWIYVNFFATFIGGFLLMYVFDVFYNRQRQILSLEKIKEKGRLPDGFEI